MASRKPIDPTKNVLALVKAAVQRVDDVAEERQNLAEWRHKALRREMRVRARYERQLARAESFRLDSLRDLDRLESHTANERHQAAVETLAKATTTMADTLRASAENTARNLAAAQDAQRKELDARISAIERFQAAGSGKGAGLNAAWVYLGGLVALLVGLYAIGSKFFGHG